MDPDVLELVACVQREAAEACSADVPIPGSLADAVAALSSWLSKESCPLKALLKSPAGALLGADLQQVYCQGSLLARYCTPEAVEQSPAAVGLFLFGLFAVANAMPLSTPVDAAALERLAGPLASALDNAAQLRDMEAGAFSEYATLQLLRKQYVATAALCLVEVEAAEQWEVGLASPTLEPLLHLALGEISAACQLAAEQPSGPPGKGEQAATAQLLDSGDLQGFVLRAHWGMLLLGELMLTTDEAACQARLNAGRLMDSAPPLTELYGSRVTQLTDSKLDMLHKGVCGLCCVLRLQLRVLLTLKSPRPSSRQEAAVTAALGHRMQWVAGAAAFAKILHSVADAAPAGSGGSGAVGLSGAGAGEVAALALQGLLTALQLLQEFVVSGIQAPHPLLTRLYGDGLLTVFQLPGAVPRLLELTELLLRLAPKLPALLGTSGARANTEHQLTANLLLQFAGWLSNEAIAEPLIQLSVDQQEQELQRRPGSDNRSSGNGSCSDGVNGGSNDSGSATPEALEALLRRVASLAGTAAKLGRCLPAMAIFEPSDVRRRSVGTRGLYAVIMCQVVDMCVRALTLNPHRVQAHCPQRSLTCHLQSTGFLAFLCLPALAQAHAGLDASERGILAALDTVVHVRDLLEELKRLDLVDVAVRGGGLGLLLRHTLELHLGPLHWTAAVDLLLLPWNVLRPDCTESLAVCLVQGGMLRVATEHCLRLVGNRRRRVTSMKCAKDVLTVVTMMIVGAVCSLLDRNCGCGLLAAFPTLLEGVPPLDQLVITEESGSNDSSPQPVVYLPRGPWSIKFYTKPAWERVCSQLMPALSAACDTLASGSQVPQQEQQDGIFRDVAVSAWACCNPGCDNLQGQQEASLPLKTCTGCGEARYCSSHCQRQDWRRHKPICRAIKELK